MDKPTVEVALGVVSEIESMIEEEISESVKAKATDFFEGVLDKSKAIGAVIELSRVVTMSQMTALENMRYAVSRWVR